MYIYILHLACYHCSGANVICFSIYILAMLLKLTHSCLFIDLSAVVIYMQVSNTNNLLSSSNLTVQDLPSMLSSHPKSVPPHLSQFIFPQSVSPFQSPFHQPLHSNLTFSSSSSSLHNLHFLSWLPPFILPKQVYLHAPLFPSILPSSQAPTNCLIFPTIHLLLLNL